MRFLIVDDSAILRKKIAEYIASIGGTVIAEAANGKDGVDKYKEHKPDLVTMDMEMPIMNGVEASREILSHDTSARILMITSSVDKKEILYCLKMGVRKVMQKPVLRNDFVDAISEIA